MLTSVSKKNIAANAALCVLLIAIACAVPSASHLLNIPIYKANPMLALLLIGIALSKDWRVGLALAVLMPVASFLTTGMPDGGKAVCMVAEYAALTSVFFLTSQKLTHTLLSIFIATVAGKIVYYGMKLLILSPATLIGTEWWIQLTSVVVLCCLFAIVYRKRVW